jgi:hypothetical protein
MFLFSLGLALFPADHDAAEVRLAATQQTVQLKIGTILAGNEGDDFDPRLSGMKNQLKVFKYRTYRLVKEESQKVSWQGKANFEIPGGRTLVVTPQEYRNERIALKVRLLKGDQPQLDTVVQLRNGGNFLLGGPAHEGGVLILSISATTP